MGNALSCCHNLSGQQIQHKEVSDPLEEWSPLLSEENSDEESPSPSQTTGDAEKSPVLDQGHAFFPDIVLSSSPGAALAVAGHSLHRDQGLWNPGFVRENSDTVQTVIMQPYREEDVLQVDQHALYGHEKLQHHTELLKQSVDPKEKDIGHNKLNIVLMEYCTAHMEKSVEAESDVFQKVAVDAGWTEGGILQLDQEAAARTTHRTQHMEHNSNQKQPGVEQTAQGVMEQMEQRTGQTEKPLEHGTFPNIVDLVQESALLSEQESQVKQGVRVDQNVALKELSQSPTQTDDTGRKPDQMGQNVIQTQGDSKKIGQIVQRIGQDAIQVKQSEEQTPHGLVQTADSGADRTVIWAGSGLDQALFWPTEQCCSGAEQDRVQTNEAQFKNNAVQLCQKQDQEQCIGQARDREQGLMPVNVTVEDDALLEEKEKEQLTLFMVDRLFLATPPLTGMM